MDRSTELDRAGRGIQRQQIVIQGEQPDDFKERPPPLLAHRPSVWIGRRVRAETKREVFSEWPDVLPVSDEPSPVPAESQEKQSLFIWRRTDVPLLSQCPEHNIPVWCNC